MYKSRIKSRKPCKSSQYRNRSTGRCRKKASAKRKSRKPCKSNQYRNRSTGRCRKKASPTIKSRKPQNKGKTKPVGVRSTKPVGVRSTKPYSVGSRLKIPKTIHALWLDFNNASDGVIPPHLHVYINRLKNVHQNWNIKIWTNWQEIESDLVNRPYMLNYIRNPFCNGANKSDCLRFHILEKYGGIWVDLSTYFIKPLDDLYNKYNSAFTTIYMPPYDMFMWNIKPLGQQYEAITVKEKIKDVYPSLHNIIKNSSDFICESYFIMSPAHHPILINILEQMENIWTIEKVDQIVNKDTHCSYVNLIMNDLTQKIYNIDPEVLKLLNYNISIYDCGYLWIYFVITIAVNNFINNNNLIKYENRLTQKQKNVMNKISSDISTYMCTESTCKDITWKDDLGIPNVHFISASWARLVKWSDTRENRLNWETTFLGNLINESYTNYISSTDFLQKLEEYNISQIKTGAYTRGPTENMIKKLDIIVNRDNNAKVQT